MRICHLSLCIVLYSVALLPAQLTFIPLRLSGPGAQEHTALNSERYGRKPYTIEQLRLLANIKFEWEKFEPNQAVRRWRLMEKGIRNGLHPDDVCEEFLRTILVQSPRGDPHETALEKVEFLLKHNANPNGTAKSGRPIISCAPTYAIARCLLDHKAQLCPIDKKRNYTLLHNVVTCDYNTAESAVSLIALFCKVGVNPNECTSNGVSPLTLLVQDNIKFGFVQAATLADTLIKVGVVEDEQFQHECEHAVFRYSTADIKQGVCQAKIEISTAKGVLHKTRHLPLVAILQDLKLSRDPATIIADYESNLHEYFIDKIITDADAELQRKRKEREKSRCVIQ